MEKTIQKQLISDVPSSLSLSGGVDSNIVYSVMRKNLDNKFNIYSFKFKDFMQAFICSTCFMLLPIPT